MLSGLKSSLKPAVPLDHLTQLPNTCMLKASLSYWCYGKTVKTQRQNLVGRGGSLEACLKGLTVSWMLYHALHSAFYSFISGCCEETACATMHCMPSLTSNLRDALGLWIKTSKTTSLKPSFEDKKHKTN